MNPKPTRQRSRAGNEQPEGGRVRRGFLVLMGIMLVIVTTAVALRQWSASRQATLRPAEPGATLQAEHQEPKTVTRSGESFKPVAPVPTPLRLAATDGAEPPAATATTPARPEPTAYTRQLVSTLSRLDQAGVPLTPELAVQWKQSLQELVEQRAAGVPAILEFLQKNTDVNFGATDSQLVGYSSARNAMFDALKQIGGAEGLQGTLAAFEGTGDPREVLTLARNIESMAPGEHRQELMNAARQTLAMAAEGQLQGYDVGPIFEVFQLYGDPTVTTDLQKALGQWQYYSAIALARLPEGAGIPTLIQMAQGGSSRDIALEMLAQTALQYPDARAAFLEQVRADKISPRHWPYLASVLGGDQYQFVDSVWYAAGNGEYVDRLKTAHIVFGNQNFYQGSPIGGWISDQLNQQMTLIDELLAVASNPAAVQALQQSKAVLSKRAPQTAAVSPGK